MQGLQVFDGAGNLVFDITTSLTSIVGEVTLTPKATATIQSEAFSNGKPFIVADKVPVHTWISYSLSGDIMTLTYNIPNWYGGTPTNVTVLCGVY